MKRKRKLTTDQKMDRLLWELRKDKPKPEKFGRP